MSAWLSPWFLHAGGWARKLLFEFKRWWSFLVNWTIFLWRWTFYKFGIKRVDKRRTTSVRRQWISADSLWLRANARMVIFVIFWQWLSDPCHLVNSYQNFRVSIPTDSSPQFLSKSNHSFSTWLILFYTITKLVRALWLAKRRDVNMVLWRNARVVNTPPPLVSWEMPLSNQCCRKIRLISKMNFFIFSQVVVFLSIFKQ